MLRPLLAFRPVERLRVLANPFVALPLWAANLYVWHLPFLYEAAVEHSAVHALEHICFFSAGVDRVAARARDAACAGVVRHRPQARLHRDRPARRDTAREHLRLVGHRLLRRLRPRRRALGDLAAAGSGAGGRGDDDRGVARHDHRARVALPAARAGGRAAPGAARARARSAGGRAAPSATGGRRSWPSAAELESSMRSSGVHHVDLVVSSIERSLPFYRELLGPLGYTRIGEVEGERGETIWYLGGAGCAVGLRQAQSEGATDRYRVGLHHVAFNASSRERGRRAPRVARRGRGRRSSRRRASTPTSPATTPSSSTTRTGSSSRSSTCRRPGRPPPREPGDRSRRRSRRPHRAS